MSASTLVNIFRMPHNKTKTKNKKTKQNALQDPRFHVSQFYRNNVLFFETLTS